MFRVKLAPMGLYIQPMPSRANVIIAICSNVHLCKPFLAKNLCVELMGTRLYNEVQYLRTTNCTERTTLERGLWRMG